MKDDPVPSRNENSNLCQKRMQYIKKNHEKQRSGMKDEDDELNKNFVEIEKINDKGYVSCEEKERYFTTETVFPTKNCIVPEPYQTELQQKTSMKDHQDQDNIFYSKYPIKNLIRYFWP